MPVQKSLSKSPDFFARGPNLEDKKYHGPQKNIANFSWLLFLHFKPKTGKFKVFSLQNDAYKHGRESLQFATGAAKNLWRAACGPRASVWPCML